MPVDLANFEDRAKSAVRLFWGSRGDASRRQEESGRADQGQRSAVTSGKNMDGFADLATEIVHANGLGLAEIAVGRRVPTLPGYFRPTKEWDLLVLHKGELVAALEFKSQVGSFGNNFNNRSEEVIGCGHDFWMAFREGAFGEDASRPFLGWIMLLEDHERSRTPVSTSSRHFDVFPEFNGASYADRYDILCRKMIQENLYSSAALMTSSREAVESGDYAGLSEMTSLRSFVAEFAGHISAFAAKQLPEGNDLEHIQYELPDVQNRSNLQKVAEDKLSGTGAHDEKTSGSSETEE